MPLARRLLPTLYALFAILLTAACGGGDKPMGELCASDSECIQGHCVGGVDGVEPVCTRSCGRASECPEGWSCSGATLDMVLVCVKGAAMPFGH